MLVEHNLRAPRPKVSKCNILQSQRPERKALIRDIVVHFTSVFSLFSSSSSSFSFLFHADGLNALRRTSHYAYQKDGQLYWRHRTLLFGAGVRSESS